MAIYEITPTAIRKLAKTTFSAAGIRERADLQRLLRTNIQVIAPDTLVVAEEFGQWDESRRRIDLLALDRAANIVVIELKRTEDGGHMELQAIRYAAMVSTLTFKKVVEVYADYLRRTGQDLEAETSILDFLGWESADEDRFAQDVRIVLASAEFSKELTTTVIWLNQRGLDIRCVRLQPYGDGGHLLVDVQQVIPLPEAAAYQIQVRDKEQRGRQLRAERSSITRQFWQGLLARAKGKTSLHANISPRDHHWIGASSGMRGLSYNYVLRQEEGAVELYIDRGTDEADTNKQIFDYLIAQKEAIESTFRGVLSWQRLNQKRGCRVAHAISIGGWSSDESAWPEIQEAMIEGMLRLEEAFRPSILALKSELV